MIAWGALGYFLFPGLMFLYVNYAPETILDRPVRFIALMGFISSVIITMLGGLSLIADKERAFKPERIAEPITIRPRNIIIAGLIWLYFCGLTFKDIFFADYHF